MAEVPGGAAERHRGPAGAKRQDDRPESRPGVRTVSARLGQVWALGGRPGVSTVTTCLGKVLMIPIGSNYVIVDKFSVILVWQKFRAALQNVPAGPPEPNCRAIGREVAQGYEPSAPA